MSVAFIYVLARPDRCKVGWSNDPLTRAKDIASIGGFTDVDLHIALPVLFEIAREIEAAAHHRLAAHRIRGEWFKVEPPGAVVAIEEAILEVTHRHAHGSRSLSPRTAISIRTPAGRKLFEARLQAMRTGGAR